MVDSMVVISKSALTVFIRSYPDAESALKNWYGITKQNSRRNFHEMRKSFNSVDPVGNDRYVLI
jgi:mRNA interferase HigB